MTGQKVCRMHGGSSPRALKAAANRQTEKAIQEAVTTYGLPRDIDPHTALIEELHRTAGIVSWLGIQVTALEATDLAGPVGGGKDSYPSYQPNVLVRLYQEERKHFADVAKICIQAGIAERQVRIAEQQGQLLAAVIQGVLTDLGVHDRPETPGIVRKHLQLVA
jgi:hypothetical protein